VGEIVPHEFNQLALKKLDENGRSNLERAIRDMGDEETHQQQRLEALKAVMVISAVANDIRTFNDVCHQWLDGDKWSAGVNKDGSIVLWDKENPESRISMAKPKE